MNKLEYGYNRVHGVGLLIEEDKRHSVDTVAFPNGKENCFSAKDFVPIHPAFSDLLFDPPRIEKMFYRTSYLKGVDYADENCVQKIDYSFSECALKATVMGTHKYKSVIMFNGRSSFFMQCSCPVGFNCKHCAAVLITLADLGQTYKRRKENDPAVLSNQIPQSIEKKLADIRAAATLSDAFFAIRSLTDELSEAVLQLSFTEELSKRLEATRNQCKFADAFHLVDIALTVDDRINDEFDNHMRRNGKLWTAHSTYGSLMKNPWEFLQKYHWINLQDVYTALAFCPTKRNLNLAFRVLLSDSTSQSVYTEFFFHFFTEHIGNTVEKDLFEFLESEEIMNVDALRLIRSELSQDFWKKAIRLYPKNMYISKEFLSELPYEEQFLLLPGLQNGRFAFEVIEKYPQSVFDTYPREMACAIEKSAFSSLPPIGKDKLTQVAERLPEADYFLAYLKNVNDFQLTSLSDVPYNFSRFEKYFDFHTEVQTRDEKCLIVLEIWSPDKRLVFHYFFDEQLERYFWDSKRYYHPDFPVFAVCENAFLSTLVRDIKRQYGSSIAQRVAEEHTVIEGKKRQQIGREMRASIAKLSDMLYTKKIQLAPALRASLAFVFTKDAEDGKEMNLSAKVSNGRGRFYLIKNFRNFISDLRSHKTVEYGKNFELTHILSNFDDFSQKALSVLLKAELFDSLRSSDKRYVLLSPFVFNDLMSALVGQKIVWDSEEYTVRLNRVPFTVSVDENNIISVSPTGKNRTLYGMEEILYDINGTDKVIDTVDGTEEVHRLVQFAFDYTGQSITPILDTFKTDIYPRLARHIEIPQEKIEDFKLGNVAIEAYFDYSERILSVRSVLKKEGKAVSEEGLTALGDKATYKNYREYIAVLGFSDEPPIGTAIKKADAWMDNDASVLSFLSMDLTELKKYCTVFLSESLQNKVLLTFQPPAVRINYRNGIMQAFAENGDFSDEELNGLLQAVRLKKKYVLLSDNRILRVDNEESEEFAETVCDLGLNETSLTLPQPIPIATSVRAFAHESNCKVDDYLTTMINDIKSFKQSKIELPKVRAEVRSYQKEGYRWLSILSDYKMGGILADDMGLGKTLEVIMLLKRDTECRPSLVVCPKSLIYNWKTEFDKFDGETAVEEIYGSAAVREAAVDAIDYGKKTVYITSYDSLRVDQEKYAGVFNYLILDEAQYIKNMRAQKSQSVKNLSAVHKFALTGTPIENNALDLWSIFDFILPGYFEDLKIFKHRYESDEHYPEIVSKRVAPFILRRTKKDVLKDLPEKFERILSTEMTFEQRKLYEAYKKVARDTMQAGGKAFDILPTLTRLRQICVDPSMFTEEYIGGSGKIALLAELLPEYIAAKHRILIFSQFVKGLESVENLLKKENIPYYKLTGETQSAERIRLVNEFNNSKTVHVFLISLKAGGTGLNLVGADTVIHLDPWWNVAAENQAADRSHRIGQTKNVEVIKIICSDSVEQKVIDLQNRKKDLVDKLIANDDSSVTGATLEDIAFIIE